MRITEKFKNCTKAEDVSKLQTFTKVSSKFKKFYANTKSSKIQKTV